MQRSRTLLTLHESIEIGERDWLTCGLIWIAIGTLAASPVEVAQAGRVLFALTLFVHLAEAVYVGFRALTVGLNPQKWFLRTIVLGALALVKLEAQLRRVPLRSVK